MKRLLLVALLLLAACGDNGGGRPAPVPASPSWTIGPIVNGANHSHGMPITPTLVGNGWYFDFPLVGGDVDYVTRAQGPVAASALRAQFRIEGSGGFVSLDGGATPAVRLFLQRAGDDWSSVGQYASFRFWSPPTPLAPGQYTVEVPLDPAQWTNVQGKKDPAGFGAMLSGLGAVGVTFGSVEASAGHGVYATAPMRFVLGELTFK